MLKSKLHKKNNNKTHRRSPHKVAKRNKTTLKNYINSTNSNKFDAIVIGAGIVGAAAAAGITTPKLAEPPAPGDLKHNAPRRVLVIEQESDFCFHSTGRSAAIYSEVYGSPTVRALSSATKPYLYNPTQYGLLDVANGESDEDLVRRRGSLWVSTRHSDEDLHQLYTHTKKLVPTLEFLNTEQLHAMLPATKYAAAREPMYYDDELAELYGADHGDYKATNAVLEVDAADMDVDKIYRSIVKLSKHNGAEYVLKTTVHKSTFHPTTNTWSITLKTTLDDGSVEYEDVETPVVVNAGGPFADMVNEQFGVAPRNIVPKKRTIIQFSPTEFVNPDGSPAIAQDEIAAFDKWPCVFDLDDRYYFKPDAGRVLASPAEETSIPEPLQDHADVVPEELDIAICVQRLEQASFFSPKNVVHKWSGLRTFAPDREFVLGYDGGNHLTVPETAAQGSKSPYGKQFLHATGCGGFGIQSIMGQARTIAGLYHNGAIPADLLQMGVDPAVICPQREMIPAKH